jgi:hypothetical protein
MQITLLNGIIVFFDRSRGCHTFFAKLMACRMQKKIMMTFMRLAISFLNLSSSKNSNISKKSINLGDIAK